MALAHLVQLADLVVQHLKALAMREWDLCVTDVSTSCLAPASHAHICTWE